MYSYFWSFFCIRVFVFLLCIRVFSFLFCIRVFGILLSMILNLIVVLNTACDRLQISQLSQLGKIIFRFNHYWIHTNSLFISIPCCPACVTCKAKLSQRIVSCYDMPPLDNISNHKKSCLNCPVLPDKRRFFPYTCDF